MSVEFGHRPVEVSVLRIEPGPRMREHRAYVRLLISDDADAALTTALTTVVPVVGADLSDDTAMAERIVEGACTWFEAYLDGSADGAGDANLFAERPRTVSQPANGRAKHRARPSVAAQTPKPTPLRLTPAQRVSCLSPQAERELTEELRAIKAEFAGAQATHHGSAWALPPY